MSVTAVARVVEREAHLWRRLWRGTVFSSIISPLLYLAAIGLGLGGLVDERTTDVAGLDYLDFVAPGLLAATAVQSAAQLLWNVMAGVKWIGSLHATVATPVEAADAFGGILAWQAVRMAMSASLFLVVAATLGGVDSPWGVLAIPAAVLCASAFAAPLAAFAATQQTDVSFPVILRLGILPLFLFSATFFPLDELPSALRPLAGLSPLWHGVELCRAATTGSVRWAAAAGHVVALVACVVAGWWWGTRTFTARLTP